MGSGTSNVDNVELFDMSLRWRAEAAEALGLVGDDLIAGVCPGASFPGALRFVLSGLPTTARTIVDIGAGAGGTSEWLRRRTVATVFAVEPSDGARETANRLFPQIRVIDGTADATGLPTGIADAVTFFGVLSLIDDVDVVFAEADRLLAPGGTLAITDLFSTGSDDIVKGRNFVRSFESVRAQLTVRGFTIVEFGCGKPSPALGWRASGTHVDEWIDECRAGEPAYENWKADQIHLGEWVASGDLIGGCLIAHRVPAEPPQTISNRSETMPKSWKKREGDSTTVRLASLDDLIPSRRSGLRSHRGRGGRTYRQLYADAQRAEIHGRSAMTKAELERALKR